MHSACPQITKMTEQCLKGLAANSESRCLEADLLGVEARPATHTRLMMAVAFGYISLAVARPP
jgi:hypothetical protein